MCLLYCCTLYAMGAVWERVETLLTVCIFQLSRPPMREACAELLATFVLVLIGNGVMAACTLGRLELNSLLVGAFGWGFAVMIAIAIAGGVSGGHVNPAVTVGLATNKKCPWSQVLPNMIAQYLGSLLAAILVYVLYEDAINEYDGGKRQLPPAVNSTAQIFATYPQDFASTSTCLWDQIIGTALLLIVVCAATDMKNLRVPPHTQPLIIGLGISAIILGFGHNCGAPLNPARDFAPRLLTAGLGWGLETISYRNYKWFWIPILGPHIGGVLGVWLYKVLIEVPFKNYSRLLEEMDNLENSRDECRRRQASYDVQRQTLNRSTSSEDGTRNMLERPVLTNVRHPEDALPDRPPSYPGDVV